MMQWVGYYYKARGAWLILALTAFLLILSMLYFQYIMLITPYILCIYQRCALFGICLSGLIGVMVPETSLRFTSMVIWLYSSWKGLLLAVKHTNIQLNPSPFVTCDFFVTFPIWFPLDKWIPSIFRAISDSTIRQWSFLSLEMSQWMIIIFTTYLAVAVIVLYSTIFFTYYKS